MFSFINLLFEKKLCGMEGGHAAESGRSDQRESVVKSAGDVVDVF